MRNQVPLGMPYVRIGTIQPLYLYTVHLQQYCITGGCSRRRTGESKGATMAVESMVSSVQTSMQSWSFSSSLPLSRLQRQLASMSTDNSLENGLSFTPLEQSMDIVLGIAFLITALVAARRMSTTLQASPASAASSPGAEAAVVTAFYSLILLTSVLRALWFLVPAQWWQPSYTPAAVYAWDSTQPSWIGTAISEIIVTGGSLSLFSIFILILVYWAGKCHCLLFAYFRLCKVCLLACLLVRLVGIAITSVSLTSSIATLLCSLQIFSKNTFTLDRDVVSLS